MKNNQKIISVAILFTAMLIGMSFAVDAFGVTSGYWKDRPLVMQPGETRGEAFSLQNMVGDEDVTLLAELKEDKRFVKLTDSSNIYIIPAKTKGVKVNFLITVPEDMKIGTTFKVAIGFVNAGAGGAKQVGIGTSITKSFDVIIGDEAAPRTEPIPLPPRETLQPAKTGIRPLTQADMIPALIILIIVLLVWLLVQRAKRKPTKRQQPRPRARKRTKHAPW